jgi:hypothetical protein
LADVTHTPTESLEEDELWEDYEIEECSLTTMEAYDSDEEWDADWEKFNTDERTCGVCGEEFEWVGSPDEEMCPDCEAEYHNLDESEGKCEKCGREGCTCGPDCDCEPVEEDTFAHDEDIPTGEYEICDKCFGDGCETCDHGLVDVTGQFKIPSFGDMMGEGIALDSIVESVLDEYRNQPKDYEMSDEELAAEIEDETSEFERDHIDKEIEDEELGLRFD